MHVELSRILELIQQSNKGVKRIVKLVLFTFARLGLVIEKVTNVDVFDVRGACRCH